MVTKQDVDGCQELHTEGKKPDPKHNHILCGIKTSSAVESQDANGIWRWTPGEGVKGILGKV